MWRHAFPLLSWILLSYLLIRFAIATPEPLQVDPPYCDKDFYGSPKIEDCNQAIFWIPKKDQAHLFAEPQLLNPPFNSVQNPYAPRAIIQLPKIFKYGESNNTGSYQIIVQP